MGDGLSGGLFLGSATRVRSPKGHAAHDAVAEENEMHKCGGDVNADKSKQYPDKLCVDESESPCG